ncbi:MAG TPA: Gfo/Idh/MocA family oxidoreductase, partial [Burkholderiales bacterium]|nr:Gfo/Idh/MocA family oxidoreductase [Burkholderiales bacterium]
MLNAAIYGIGRWGGRLIDSVQGSAKIRLVKGVTRDPASHKELAAKTGLTLTESYVEVLRDPHIDAVVLATPHSQHHDQIVQAAKAGKHVYCEKPFTLTRETAQKAVDACRAAGITLTVGFNRRHAPAFVDMMRRIRAGEIGNVLHIEGQHSGASGYRLKAGGWRTTRVEAPAGGMTARGIHTLDSMIQIAGLVKSVYAFSDHRTLPADIPMDDTTSMLLRFAGGITGYLGTVFVTGELWRLHVFGTKGWLEMRGANELTVCGLEGTPQKLSLPAVDMEKATLEAFADAVAAKQPFVVPPEHVVNGIAVLEAIVAS